MFGKTGFRYIRRLSSLYFTITESNNIFRHTEDFVITVVIRYIEVPLY